MKALDLTTTFDTIKSNSKQVRFQTMHEVVYRDLICLAGADAKITTEASNGAFSFVFVAKGGNTDVRALATARDIDDFVMVELPMQLTVNGIPFRGGTIMELGKVVVATKDLASFVNDKAASIENCKVNSEGTILLAKLVWNGGSEDLSFRMRTIK